MIGQAIAMNALIFLQQTVPPGPGGLTPDERTQIAIEALRRPVPSVPGGVLVPLFFFGFLIVVIWLRTRVRQRRIQAQADLQKQLLDKFTNGPDLATFMESPGGQRFLAELHSQTAGTRAHVVRTVQTGIILLTLGTAFLVLKVALPGNDLHGHAEFLVGGVIVSALGIGFLISAAVSHRLTKKWDAGHKADGPAAPIS